MQLVDLSTDPRHLARKVDFIAQYIPSLRVGSERIHRAVDNRARLLLVVEDGERRAGHDGSEYRERARPSECGC